MLISKPKDAEEAARDKRLNKATFMYFLLLFSILTFGSIASAKMQQNTWSPDTCDKCEIVYEWDDTVSQDQRVHTVVEVINAPVDFKNDTKEVQYDKILKENQRKNIAIGEVIRQNPKLVNAEGNFKPGMDINFFYDNLHILHLKTKGLNPQEKVTTQEKINAKVGVGKAILE